MEQLDVIKKTELPEPTTLTVLNPPRNIWDTIQSGIAQRKQEIQEYNTRIQREAEEKSTKLQKFKEDISTALRLLDGKPLPNNRIIRYQEQGDSITLMESPAQKVIVRIGFENLAAFAGAEPCPTAIIEKERLNIVNQVTALVANKMIELSTAHFKNSTKK